MKRAKSPAEEEQEQGLTKLPENKDVAAIWLYPMRISLEHTLEYYDEALRWDKKRFR